MIRFRSEELACRCREYLSECVWLMVLLDAYSGIWMDKGGVGCPNRGSIVSGLEEPSGSH